MLPALKAAAERTGVDFAYLFHTARMESAFRPDARARTSSATGLFQFIDSTWLATVQKHGAAHGIHPANRAEALGLRTDPAVASLMAAAHAAENASSIEEGLGRKPTAAELYLAHFLGSGGAIRFLKGLAANPAMAAAELLPSAARANSSVFFSAGAPRSLRDVYDFLVSRFNGAAGPFAAPPARSERQASAWDEPTPTSGPKPAVLASLPAIEALAARIFSSEQHAADVDTVKRLAFLPRAKGDGEFPAQDGIGPRAAAQAAYLLLAELGV